jgi:hypothetical protein
MKRIWIYDLETLDIFTATFEDKDSEEIRQFVISNKRDNRKELFQFLDTEVEGLIGFNSIGFDQQILEYLYKYPECSAKQIRAYANTIVSDNNRKPDVPEWRFRIPNLDLFRALSLSVKAKRTGLKWCEYQTDFENIEDLPSDGDGDSWEEQVLSYNLNDVKATKFLYQKYKYEIELRQKLTDKEGIDLMNSTEPDMAKKLFTKYLSKAMNIPENYLRSMGTDRDVVNIEEILFPYIEFQTKPFQNVLDEFKKLNLNKTDKFETVLNHQGIEITYALGGIHAAPKNRIFESDGKFVIKSVDAKSFYPHLSFKNQLCPEHLPKEVFIPLYEGFYHERNSIPKKDPRNYILKILLNSAYGMTNDEYSFLRDRKVTLAICINGQLLLSMLIEKLTQEIPECQLIMMNTDGLEIIMPRDQEEKYQGICNWWEDITEIPLEHVEYSKMIIADCNNYISIFNDGTTKCKGKFEFENIPLHKNKSHSIIPRAVHQYFVHGIPVEQTILEHQNIFDFCAGVKAKFSPERGQSRYELHSVEGIGIKKEKLSKTVRYYISTKGKWLFKCYENGIQEHVEAPLKIGRRNIDWKVTYFNKSWKCDIKYYGINYNFYIYNAKKWILDIEQNSKQNTLF